MLQNAQQVTPRQRLPLANWKVDVKNVDIAALNAGSEKRVFSAFQGFPARLSSQTFLVEPGPT